MPLEMRPAMKDEGWRCPTCGRRFKQRTREHSCTLRTLGSHLDNASAAVKNTVATLQDALATIGPHAMVPVKTMILLRATANFAGLVIRRDCLHLEFMLMRPVDHARIHKRQPLGAGRYSHHTRLTSPADVDEELVGWLRESYSMVADRRPRRRVGSRRV
jgi:hypothetical protein